MTDYNFGFTDEDKNLLGNTIHLDPLGTLPIWQFYARNLIPNLTEQSSNLEGFYLLAIILNLYEKYNKYTVKFKLNGRHQTATLYTFKNLFLISSRAGRPENIIKNPRFNMDASSDYYKLKDWVYRENRRLKFGYLHFMSSERKKDGKKGGLYFCERIFPGGISKREVAEVARILFMVAHIADNYEASITGEDIE